jgi:hypothetical protein
MAIYMIGYDLHRSNGDTQDKLFSALEVIGTGYWDCLDSTWLIITERTAAEIRDQLKQHLSDDDRLLVMRYGEGAAWLGFKDRCEAWLKDNLGVPSDAAIADTCGQSYCGA